MFQTGNNATRQFRKGIISCSHHHDYITRVNGTMDLFKKETARAVEIIINAIIFLSHRIDQLEKAVSASNKKAAEKKAKDD